jgi:hypothetical protein
MEAERQLSFETPACRDMNFGAEELNSGTEALEPLPSIDTKTDGRDL